MRITDVRRDRISITDYDDSWPRSFEVQRRVVTDAFQDCLIQPVEHVGSTSVPGLPAKSIIDMLAVVADIESVGAALSRLARNSWVLAPEPGDVESRKHSLCYPTPERRTHHLHVVENGWGWEDLLLFRDYLREHPAVAGDYAELKRSLAAIDDQDRPRYRSAKAPFILAVLDKARQHRQS